MNNIILHCEECGEDKEYESEHETTLEKSKDTNAMATNSTIQHEGYMNE